MTKDKLLFKVPLKRSGYFSAFQQEKSIIYKQYQGYATMNILSMAAVVKNLPTHVQKIHSHTLDTLLPARIKSCLAHVHSGLHQHSKIKQQ